VPLHLIGERGAYRLLKLAAVDTLSKSLAARDVHMLSSRPIREEDRMSDIPAKDRYERTLMEMVLRHRLPDDCDVRIEVDTGEKTAAATFSLRESQISVDSDIKSLNLNRLMLRPPPNW
jgi:hypothetical protein